MTIRAGAMMLALPEQARVASDHVGLSEADGMASCPDWANPSRNVV